MKDRDEGRALPAGRDVGAPRRSCTTGNAEPLGQRQRRRRSAPSGAARGGAARSGRGSRRRRSRRARCPRGAGTLDERRMAVRRPSPRPRPGRRGAVALGHDPRIGRAPREASSARPRHSRATARRRGAAGLAVRLDQGEVDAVERGSRHQADRRQHGVPPVQCADEPARRRRILQGSMSGSRRDGTHKIRFPVRASPSAGSSTSAPTRTGSTQAARPATSPPMSAMTARRPRCMSAPDLDHDAALAAEDRPPADRADGRRNDARRRPLRPRRDAQDPHRRADRGQQERDQAVSSSASSTSAMASAR